MSSWPKQISVGENKNDSLIWSKLIEILGNVRQAKSEAKKSMKAEIILTLSKEDKKLLEDCLADLKSVTCSKEIREGKFNIEFA